jgi:hypothetical protein
MIQVVSFGISKQQTSAWQRSRDMAAVWRMKKAGIITEQQYRKSHTAASGSESASYPDQLQMGEGW